MRKDRGISPLPLLAQMAMRPRLPRCPLPLDNAQAKALNYVEDAATVKNPMFKAGSSCANASSSPPNPRDFPTFAEPKGWCHPGLRHPPLHAYAADIPVRSSRP